MNRRFKIFPSTQDALGELLFALINSVLCEARLNRKKKKKYKIIGSDSHSEIRLKVSFRLTEQQEQTGIKVYMRA